MMTAFTGLIAAVLQREINGLRHQVSRQRTQISALKSEAVPNAPGLAR